MRVLCFFVLIFAVLQAEKRVYALTTDSIDVVIPCSIKDIETLELCVEGIKNHCVNLGRVIVVSQEMLTAKAEWFDEALFPFDKEAIALQIFHGDSTAARGYIDHPQTRIGWIFQQLLKLYVHRVIPNLSPNCLILDADVMFTQPISFLSPAGEPFFSFSIEHTKEYLEHAFRLLPDLKQAYSDKCGIAHHMLFQKPILEDLLTKVETHHQMESWQAILHCIDPQTVYGPALSEYEIYFNFACLNTDQAILRKLRSYNIQDLRLFKVYSKHNFAYLTSHSWSRDNYLLNMRFFPP
jgi:hypothetical protein